MFLILPHDDPLFLSVLMKIRQRLRTINTKVVGFLHFQSDTEASKRAWKIACSFSPAVVEVPRGETFVVGPIDFPGGCSSKVSLLLVSQATFNSAVVTPPSIHNSSR
ncbi:uncharacterized protein LOC116249033 isoform X2 [Nymphaea colorata]|uniref:uncharacterized protein LOC116249033 isoform X2 n=1 Tax=Nymphaea colorata TaxID=210225 RepID=UPI00129D66A8|nr:uncharacterized protein LOC116249033 isoform X2 [Nymphaea colorata]